MSSKTVLRCRQKWGLPSDISSSGCTNTVPNTPACMPWAPTLRHPGGLPWRCFNIPMSLLHWEAQNWTLYPNAASEVSDRVGGPFLWPDGYAFINMGWGWPSLAQWHSADSCSDWYLGPSLSLGLKFTDLDFFVKDDLPVNQVGVKSQPPCLLADGTHFSSKSSCSSPFVISQFSNTLSIKLTFPRLYRSIPQIMELIFSLIMWGEMRRSWKVLSTEQTSSAYKFNNIHTFFPWIQNSTKALRNSIKIKNYSMKELASN